MAELSDIANEFLRDEIEEFIERPEERQRLINLYAAAAPEMQAIAAALIEGEDDLVDEMTVAALARGTDALEVMDDGLIAGMGVCGYGFDPRNERNSATGEIAGDLDPVRAWMAGFNAGCASLTAESS